MILKRVIVHKYKTFIEEQVFEVENDITCLVGKNESGKSALLEAIAKTDQKNENFLFDFTHDCPRSLYVELKNQEGHCESITCEYELEDKELKEIESCLGPGVLQHKVFKYTSTFDNIYYLKDLAVNFKSFRNFVSKKYVNNSKLEVTIKNNNSFQSLWNTLKKNKELSKARQFLDIISKAKDDNFECYISAYIYNEFIIKWIPRVLYFNEYYNLPHRFSLQDLINENKNERLTQEQYTAVKALFDLSHINTSDLLKAEYEDLKIQLDACSNNVTKQFFEYWKTQHKLKIKFDIESGKEESFITIRVENDNDNTSLLLKNRSTGFVWFFSFFVLFSQIKQKSKEKIIILLDEPGLSLHASAQHDLLKFMKDKLSTNYQVIYSTHSPFMIDANEVNKIRTISENENHFYGGSCISCLSNKSDLNTVMPVKAALGFDFAQSLFNTQKYLIIEGQSDFTYLSYFSSLLNDDGLRRDIALMPIQGVSKVVPFIKMLENADAKFACVLDTIKDQKFEQNLKNSLSEKTLKTKVLYYHQTLHRIFADVEDMFTVKDYLKLYNATFDKDLKPNQFNNDEPILKQIREKGREFNHNDPAKKLAEITNHIEFSQKTKQNFSKLFKSINGIFEK